VEGDVMRGTVPISARPTGEDVASFRIMVLAYRTARCDAVLKVGVIAECFAECEFIIAVVSVLVVKMMFRMI
jgi:hypothetical protein